MIGALSIVRFRNPVKNPLELIIFFALLTSGISFAVNIIEAKTMIDFLNDHVALVLFSHIKEPEEVYYYKLAVKDKNELDEIKNKLQTVKEIKSLEIKLLDQRL